MAKVTKVNYDELNRTPGNDETFTYIDDDGKEHTVKIGDIKTGYYWNNWFRTSRASDVVAAFDYLLQAGDINALDNVNKEEFSVYLTNKIGHEVAESEIDEILYDAKKLYSRQIPGNFGFEKDLNNTVDAENAQQSAYDAYYRDLYSLKDGTLGKTMIDNLAEAERNAAVSNMQLAEAQYQQQAMQQAETVKAITDQVRTERMARLRAGMSEAQIANQDMQTMLTNMNTLNQQAATMNQNRLAAQQQYNLAQDTAYQQYIQNATAMGGTSAAFAASDAGSAHAAALNYMRMTGETNYSKALAKVQGGNS